MLSIKNSPINCANIKDPVAEEKALPPPVSAINTLITVMHARVFSLHEFEGAWFN